METNEVKNSLKKRIRTIFMLIFILLLGAAAFGCGGAQEQAAGQAGEVQPLKIVTSFYPMYVMTINITRDVPGVEVINMTKPQTGCLHDYQFTPDDMKLLDGAGIMVINGAGMESFMQKVIDQQPDLSIIDASHGLALLKNASDGEPNPHLFVSISGAIAEVKNIGGELASLDPAHADLYRRNTEDYIGKLEELRTRMHAVLDPLPHKKIVTFHEAFPYFAQEFALKIAAVVEREPGAEPSAGELAETIDLVNASHVQGIFAEPQYSAKAADTIARETGIRVYPLDPAVSGLLEPDGYITIMEENLKILQEALR